MKIIGLTGQSGSGKGTLAALFFEAGIPVVDADAVYHKLLIPPSPCLDELRTEFTDDILNPDGTLNRPVLAALVFDCSDAGKARLRRLNEITHRYVTERTVVLLDGYAAQGNKTAVIDAPLLIEAGLHQRCDRVIAVLADRDVRVDRLMARDGLDRERVLARLDAQPDVSFYIDHADILVYNNGTEQDLRAQFSHLLKEVSA
jgi:dephospho-CoA kinase